VDFQVGANISEKHAAFTFSVEEKERRKQYKILFRKPKGINSLEDGGIAARIILK
jgi:hypothetical protein